MLLLQYDNITHYILYGYSVTIFFVAVQENTHSKIRSNIASLCTCLMQLKKAPCDTLPLPKAPNYSHSFIHNIHSSLVGRIISGGDPEVFLKVEGDLGEQRRWRSHTVSIEIRDRRAFKLLQLFREFLDQP